MILDGSFPQMRKNNVILLTFKWDIQNVGVDSSDTFAFRVTWGMLSDPSPASWVESPLGLIPPKLTATGAPQCMLTTAFRLLPLKRV